MKASSWLCFSRLAVAESNLYCTDFPTASQLHYGRRGSHDDRPRNSIMSGVVFPISLQPIPSRSSSSPSACRPTYGQVSQTRHPQRATGSSSNMLQSFRILYFARLSLPLYAFLSHKLVMSRGVALSQRSYLTQFSQPANTFMSISVETSFSYVSLAALLYSICCFLLQKAPL